MYGCVNVSSSTLVSCFSYANNDRKGINSEEGAVVEGVCAETDIKVQGRAIYFQQQTLSAS